MNKATIVKGALKASKSKTIKAQNVTVVNTPTVKVADKPIKSVPSLRLSSDDLPAIKGWKVGQTYKLAIEVKLTGLNQGSMYEMVDGPDDKKTSANFKVTSVRST